MDYSVLCLCILLQVCSSATGNLLVAQGMRRKPAVIPLVAVGTALLMVGFGTYAMLLHYLPLSVMAPAGGASYLLVTIFSRIFLREPVPSLRWTGTGVLAMGVLMVVISKG